MSVAVSSAGETFGSDVACEKGTLLYMFYAGNLAVLLFKNPFYARISGFVREGESLLQGCVSHGFKSAFEQPLDLLARMHLAVLLFKNPF